MCYYLNIQFQGQRVKTRHLQSYLHQKMLNKIKTEQENFTKCSAPQILQ